MPDTETTQPQAGTEPNTSTSTAAGAGDGAGQEPKTFDADYVSKLRAEAAAHRKEASELKGKVKEFEDAKLSETDRLTKAAQEAQELARSATEKATQRVTRALLIAEASKLGFADPADANALVDAKAIAFDDDGEPTNLAALLGELAQKKPYLVGTSGTGSTTPPQVGATNPARGTNRGGSTFTTSQIEDRAFWNANKDAIMVALREGRIVEG